MIVAALLLVWSIIGNPPSSIGQETPVQEPDTLLGYTTFADSMPVQSYLDHQLRLVPLGPAIAHAQSEVSMPSAASSIAWLVDNGVANGLHGTSTGNRVPTEASAQQPGGEEESEFKVAGGPIGNESLMTVRAGRAYARAEHSDAPEGYANAFFKDLAVLPAAGSPSDPPGTFDPDATHGENPGETDPAPRGKMAILSVGSIASTSRSFRDGDKLVSIGIAEIKDINLGNRTSDNRCTNCIRIDWIRAEAYAEANGQPGGSRAAYRVTAGRACRRAFDAETGVERDRCLPLDPRDPQGNRGLRSVNELEGLNDQFERPFWTTISDGRVDYTIGVRIHVGSPHCSPARAQRTASPKDDPCRNYAYPDPRPKDPKKPSSGQVAPDRDNGQVAKALAEGVDVEIWTITASQLAADLDRRIDQTPAGALLRQIDRDPSAPGIQVCGPDALCDATGEQSIPTETVTSVRRVHLTLGVARAVATVRPAFGVGGVGGGVGGPGGAPSFGLPGVGGPPDIGGVPAEGDGAGGATVTGTGGLTGPFKVRLDWSAFGVKPWPPYDMAKAIATGAMAFGVVWLGRRRLLARGGG